MHVAVRDAPLAAQREAQHARRARQAARTTPPARTSMKPWSAVAMTSDSVPARRASRRRTPRRSASKRGEGLGALRAEAVRDACRTPASRRRRTCARRRTSPRPRCAPPARRACRRRRAAAPRQWRALYSRIDDVLVGDHDRAHRQLLEQRRRNVDLLRRHTAACERQHVAAAAERQRGGDAARFAEIGEPAGEAVLERRAAGVRSGDRRRGGRGKHRGDRRAARAARARRPRRGASGSCRRARR